MNLSKPFTRRSLDLIREALKASLPSRMEHRSSGNAAVLIPLCNVQETPGILFQLRNRNLSSHSGEVSFPGGRVDNTDPSILSAALRETEEEIGIHPRYVQVLGEIGPPEVNLRADLTVWPFVGFVHDDAEEYRPPLDNEPLPSLNLETLRRKTSQTEVELLFHLPLSACVAPSRLRTDLFRGVRPYNAVDVTDIVQSLPVGRVEIWGLTGWYLSLLLKSIL